MRKRIASRILLALVLSGAASCSKDQTQQTIDGLEGLDSELLQFRVVDEQGNPIKEAVFSLSNESVISVNDEGVGTAITEQRPLYQVSFSAPDYYSIVHTFSEIERMQLDGQFPPVRLVEKKDGRVMLAFTGDIMLGRRYFEPYEGEPKHLHEDSLLEDTKQLLLPIKSYLEQADYVSVNLESPILSAEPESRSPKNIVFFSRPETLEALSWAGVDHVSLGNNHSADYLDLGLLQTIEYLDSSDLAYSGAGMTEAEALEAAEVKINQVPYSILGYVGWAGTVVPSQVAEGDSQGGAALGSIENIVSSVSTQPDASAVIVEYHGSAEYSDGPTEQTIERLHAAIDAGADLVVGHHPHVLHGFEIYKEKLIAYSLGNFLFDQFIYETQRSAMLYVWMDQDRFHSAEVVPLYINNYRPTPAVGAIRDYALRRLKRQSVSESLGLSHSGGHLIIHWPESELSSELSEITLKPNQVVTPLSWGQQARTLRLKENTSYRVGRDLWAYGDFETEGHYGLKGHNWNFSNSHSGISEDHAIDRFATRLVKVQGEEATSFTQKYFLRVWDNQTKSVSLSAYTDSPAEIELCLEMRGPDTSAAEARANPEVRCLGRQQIQPGDWAQLVFDFTPPPQEYRGLRFRFDFYGDSDDHQFFYADNIRFISWEETGVAEHSNNHSLVSGNQYNVFEFRNAENPDCCALIYSDEI